MATDARAAETIEQSILQMFDRLDDKLVRTGLELPSAVETALEAKLGLGEAWREWWTESGEEYR